jgi:hypothetical protein
MLNTLEAKKALIVVPESNENVYNQQEIYKEQL